MVAFDGSEACSRAEAYYHDLLESGECSAVPQDVVAHVQHCSHCQYRLQRLREALLDLEREGDALQSQADRDLVGELEAQFDFLDRPLTCRQVKPFLPNLLAAETQIRIPTPVTVHVDQCPECAKDLESLRALNLSSAQLARLGRLYADSAVDGFWVCLRVQSSTTLGWSGSLEHADAKAIDHLCVCPRCRHRLYRHRQRLLEREGAGSTGPEALDCADLSDAELFDFVVPYGSFEPSEGKDRFRRCAEHIRSCPHCLARAQQLHRTVYGILDRSDSGVVTVYRTRSKRRSEEQAESLYGDYPVDVQVTRREADEAVGTGARTRGVAALKPVFRMALTAAAVIPLVLVFVVSTRSALGLNPRQLQKIAAANPCVHVTIFGADSGSPRQELWVSSADGLLISRRGDRSIIFDLTRKRRTVIGHPEGRLDVDPLGDAEAAVVEGEMEALLGLSARSPIWNVELEAIGESRVDGVPVEVYESNWRSSGSGDASGPQHKWKVYVEAATRRPLKVEFYGWESFEGRWGLEGMRRFAYPAAGEVRRQAEALQAFE